MWELFLPHPVHVCCSSTVHFRAQCNARTCNFFYAAGLGALYGGVCISCQLKPPVALGSSRNFSPRFTKGWMFGPFEVSCWVSYALFKIKLIRFVTCERLTVTWYCLRGHTYTARGNGWTPPPIISIHTVAVLMVVVAFQLVFVENILFYKIQIYWRAFGSAWLCVGHRVIQGDAVDVRGQLNVLLLRFFWILVVFQISYVCVVKLLATLLWIMCYLCFLQR